MTEERLTLLPFIMLLAAMLLLKMTEEISSCLVWRSWCFPTTVLQTNIPVPFDVANLGASFNFLFY
jgi:hypothetical protein